MQDDEATVTLYAMHTAEGFAEACRDHAEDGPWPAPCPVGWLFACPLTHLGDGRCAKVEAKDWEAVMVEVGDDSRGKAE